MDSARWTWIAVGLMAGTLLMSLAFYYLGIGAFIFIGVIPIWLFRRR